MSTASGGSIFSRTYGLNFFFDFTTCHWASAGAGRTIGPWMVEVLGVQIVPASCVGLVLRWWDIDIYIYTHGKLQLESSSRNPYKGNRDKT